MSFIKIIIYLALVFLFLGILGHLVDFEKLLNEDFEEINLPKTNYNCMDIVPGEIQIGDESQKLTTINTNFINGININYGRAMYGSENCERDLRVGSNVHKFSCVAKFYVSDKVSEDGTIVKDSYLVSYDFEFDDRECNIIKYPGRVFGNPNWIREHPHATILSCENFTSSCSWRYSNSDDYRLTKVDVKNLVKEI